MRKFWPVFLMIIQYWRSRSAGGRRVPMPPQVKKGAGCGCGCLMLVVLLIVAAIAASNRGGVTQESTTTTIERTED